MLAFLLCILKLIDAFGGFWYGTFQKNNRLDISGYSLFAQMVVTLLAFAVGIVISKNMLIGVGVAIAAEAAWVFIYNPVRQRQICPMDKPDFNFGQLKKLFIQLLPVFLASLLSNYLVNMPKYAIQSYATNDMQATFGVIFMPSFAINLLTIFILRPTLTPLAERWAAEDIAGFYKKTVQIILYIFAASAIVILAAWLIGIPVLEIIFGFALDNCRAALVITLLGGALLALANVFYNAIVIMRKQHTIIIAYVVSLIIGFLTEKPLIENFGIYGASWLYCIVTGTLLVCYIVLMIVCIKRMGLKRRIEG
jgi:O-antigen/teichoic acid export membrane protein